MRENGSLYCGTLSLPVSGADGGKRADRWLSESLTKKTHSALYRPVHFFSSKRSFIGCKAKVQCRGLTFDMHALTEFSARRRLGGDCVSCVTECSPGYVYVACSTRLTRTTATTRSCLMRPLYPCPPVASVNLGPAAAVSGRRGRF